MGKWIKVFLLVLFSLSVAAYEAKAQVTGIQIVGDSCNGLTLHLGVTGASNSPYFTWNFGDPASGANNTITIMGVDQVPTHPFSKAGFYTICVSFQEPQTLVSTVCRTIFVGPCCSGSISLSDTCLQNDISFSLITNPAPNSITWNFNDPSSGVNNTFSGNLPKHRFSAVGNYTVSATVNASCGTFTTIIPVSIAECPPSNSCGGTISVSNQCLVPGTAFSINSTSTVNSILWNFDDPISGVNNTSLSIAPVHVFSSIGTYQVQAIVNFDCGIDTLFKTIQIVNCDSMAQDCKVYIPSGFTPNGDGLNDHFAPIINCTTEVFECLVYNRWGGLVFKTSNLSEKWQGESHGAACSSGVYFYSIKYKFPTQPLKTVGGTIMLVR